MITELAQNEYNPYYLNYIKKAKHDDIVLGLQHSKEEFASFVTNLPEDKWLFSYADSKWTIAEVMQHLIDTERIFSYRALCFARNDKSALPGFNQDEYVPYANANKTTKKEMLADFLAVRESTISLFKRLTPDMSARIGEASQSPMSARAVGYIVPGHQQHHFEVINERYL
ncbi:DinB family protein [Aquimarina intermedia]|uniref:DinB family protein n=1 Tax=Aquimarina intermedia TaxID=350814 RepID=A0A5S5C940_9FLAO|nr:DinB family protein [Aquimarina intermedia]TYP75012.1 DinB family protein [Aquimarina intermedia]